MKRIPNPNVPAFGWKRQKSRHGREYFHYPSDIARQLWLYPLAIGRAKTPPGEAMSHECNDRYLLHYVVRGELWHQLGDRRVVARAGDACLLDLGQPFTHGADGPQPAISYWVSLNGKDMERCYRVLGADLEPVFTALDGPACSRLFRDLMRLTSRDVVSYEWRAAGLLTLLLAELHAVRVRTRPSISLGAESARYSLPVRRGIEWIVREYDNPYSIKELYHAVGFSRSYYSRRFRAETGIPPLAWLNRYRIEQAKRLLAHSHKSMAEIARAVGMSDQNYFARQFRRITGSTPSAYRRGMGA